MKKLYIPVILITIFVMGSFVYTKAKDPERQRQTEQTLEDVKDLPEEDCPCWDSGEETCYPQKDCV